MWAQPWDGLAEGGIERCRQLGKRRGEVQGRLPGLTPLGLCADWWKPRVLPRAGCLSPWLHTIPEGKRDIPQKETGAEGVGICEQAEPRRQWAAVC